jgi:hypothetical protein
MFPSLHKLLIDDLASIILARLDMNGLFDNGIRSTAKGLASTVLRAKQGRSDQLSSRNHYVGIVTPGKGLWLIGRAWCTRVGVGLSECVSESWESAQGGGIS